MELKQALLEEETADSSDLFPTKKDTRTWSFGHFFSIWMGSVHNIPSYITIGGFFAIGLSVWQVFSIIMISSILLAAMMVLNGHAGGKYGIPFSILLRASYGIKGALIPGVLRGLITAIMWFGLQTYAGSIAILILIGKFWPSFLTIGGNWSFLGLGLPNLIAFIIFWLIHILFIFTGISALGKLTKLISPLVFVVFGGMSIWAIHLAGGITPILSYSSRGVEGNSFFIFIACMSAILATWVAQILSVSDVTRFSRSNKEQALGQILGLIFTYLLFAVASITIIIGSEIAFGVPIWNVLEAVDRFDNKFSIALSLLTICLSTLSVNIIGNIIPAGNQLATLFPGKINFKLGALIATTIGILIMPWKLMENSTSIFSFLNIVGGLLSPVIGVMLTHYFFISKRKIHIEELYSLKIAEPLSGGVNIPALLATVMAGGMSLSGKYIAFLEPLYRISWFTGILFSVLLYTLFFYMNKRFTNKQSQVNLK